MPDVVVEAESVQFDDDDSFIPRAEFGLAERVLAEPAPSPKVLLRAVSGSDGAFHLAGLPLDRTVRLTAVPAPPLVPTALLTRPKVTPARSVALRLVPGHALRVHVVGARGEGIVAHVAVRPWPPRTDSDFDEEEGAWSGAEATSDAEGDAVLEALPGGEVLVTVVAPGLGAVQRRVVLPMAATLPLALGDTEGGVLEGSVRDTTGEPVPGATLAWATGSWWEPVVQIAQTDAASRFRLEGVPPGTVRLVRVDAPGLVLPAAQALRFGGVAIPAASPVEVVLEPAGAISGSVRDATGTPVVGAEIVVHYEEPTRLSNRSGTRFTRTAEDGTYTIPRLCPGRGWVRVKDLAPALPLRVPSHEMLRHVYEVPFVLHEAGDTCELDFVVRAGSPPVLSGRVEDEAGEPVGGAIVTATRLMNAMDETPSASARSDASGRFAIPLPTAYPSWGVVAVSGERMSHEANVQVGEAEPVLRVSPWATVSGRVVSATGEPLAGAVVVPREQPAHTSRSSTRSNPIAQTVVTDAEGRFEVRGLREGKVSFWISYGGGWVHPIRLRDAPPPADVAVFTATPGTVRRDVVLRALPTGTVAGTVTDTAGQRIAGASVALELDVRSAAPRRRARTTTDAAGGFRAEGLVEGPYAVAVNGEQSGKLATGTLDAEITIPEPPQVVRRTIEGMVIGPDGEPVALARVDVEGAAKSVEGTGLILQGRFCEVVEMGSRPGPGRVRITHAYDATGRPLGTLEESVVIPEGETETIDVQLRRGEVVDGRVVDQDGQPVGGVVVSLDFVEGPFSEPGGALEGYWWTRTRDDGTFRFVGLERADRLVHVRPEGDGVAPPGISVEQGATGLRLEIVRGVRISGIVLDESGERFPAAKVSATWQGRSPGEIRGVATDERAVFTLVVPTDAEHVTVRARFMPVEMPGAPKAVARDVKPGTQDLVLRFSRGGVLRGTVVGPDGEPVPSGWVLVLAEPDDPVPAPSPFGPAQRPYGGITAGAFEVRDAPEGRRRVVAVPQGEEYAPSDVVEVTIPGDGVKIRVPRCVEVAVQVEGGDGAVFDAVWTGAAADGTPVWRTGRVGDDGRLALRLPPAMAGTLYVRSSTDDRYVFVESFAAEGGSELEGPVVEHGPVDHRNRRGLEPGRSRGGDPHRQQRDVAYRGSGVRGREFHAARPSAGQVRDHGRRPCIGLLRHEPPPQVVEAGAQDVVIRSGIRRIQAR